jgi:hypothetical protein
MHEAAHILAADQRNVVAELLVKQLDQAAAMAGFLLAHAVEDRGRCRKLFAQALGIFRIDALVIFLQGNCQRQDLALRETIEAFHTIQYDGAAGESSAETDEEPDDAGDQQ